MKFNNLFLIDDDTTSNFLDTRLIKNYMITENLKVFNYANIALDELKQLVLTDSPEFPDLILLDIQMPYMNGWQFIEEFQKFPEAVLSKCKLFIFSSSINPQDIEKSKTYKVVNGFISKPLTIDKLNNLNQAPVKN
ncbi:MAG: response regulator [Parafilimonas sp.]